MRNEGSGKSGIGAQRASQKRPVSNSKRLDASVPESHSLTGGSASRVHVAPEMKTTKHGRYFHVASRSFA